MRVFYAILETQCQLYPDDLIFFLQHYDVFLQVAGVFFKFRPRAFTYCSEPKSCCLAYGTALFGPVETQCQ